ncbi:MAG: GNAT family N-acetyltransferase [Eubacteriales bacterium]
MKLVKPSLAYKAQVISYKEEFSDCPHLMHGTAQLHDAPTYEAWLERVQKFENPATVPEGYVSSSTFLLVREEDDAVVGMADIRHSLTPHLAIYGGHISFSIRPSERGKGYSKEILRLALEFCRDELKLKKVLATCDKCSPASIKTILSGGGVLVNEVMEAAGTTQRYWITL